MYEGRNQLRIHLPEGQPPEGFEAAKPTLEDAYLLLAQGNANGSNGTGGEGDGDVNAGAAMEATSNREEVNDADHGPAEETEIDEPAHTGQAHEPTPDPRS